MRSLFAAGLVASTIAGASAQYCANAQNLGGNYYCSRTTAISYVGLGGSGSYNLVTGMDKGTGKCSTTTKSYGGPLAPFDEDLAFFWRGPGKILRFAVYQPSGVSARKRGESSAIKRREAAKHMHQHQKRDFLHEVEEAATDVAAKVVRDEISRRANVVVETVYEEVVEFVNEWFNGQRDSTAASVQTNVRTATATLSTKGLLVATSSSSTATATPTKYFWNRVASYDSSNGHADGLVFLNTKGGGASGTFDTSFGMSLSYMASNGIDAAASPQVLGNVMTPSNVEYSIWSDSKCDGSCDFYRPGSVAHKGWAGGLKAFFFEFTMPMDGKSGFNMDMPSAWLLNGRVARTVQYPNDPSCACWKSGCGEADLFEVLDSGNTKCKSTIHNNQGPSKAGGGSSFYFDRPTSGSMVAAAIFDGSELHVQVLPAGTQFSEGFTKDGMQAFIKPNTIFNIEKPYA